MSQHVKITKDGNSVQIHVSEDTVAEIVCNSDTFTINIFRNGKGWDTIGDFPLQQDKS